MHYSALFSYHFVMEKEINKDLSSVKKSLNNLMVHTCEMRVASYRHGFND